MRRCYTKSFTIQMLYYANRTSMMGFNLMIILKILSFWSDISISDGTCHNHWSENRDHSVYAPSQWEMTLSLIGWAHSQNEEVVYSEWWLWGIVDIFCKSNKFITKGCRRVVLHSGYDINDIGWGATRRLLDLLPPTLMADNNISVRHSSGWKHHNLRRNQKK